MDFDEFIRVRILTTELTHDFLFGLDQNSHIIEKTEWCRPKHVIILIVPVGTVIDADARMRCRMNVKDFGVLKPAHLNLVDAVQWHIFEANDFVQLRIVFGH